MVKVADGVPLGIFCPYAYNLSLIHILYILPILILLIFAFALLRKFNAYDAFVSGAKEGLSLFVTLFPSLLAMMFAVSLPVSYTHLDVYKRQALFLRSADTVKPDPGAARLRLYDQRDQRDDGFAESFTSTD